MKRTCVAEPSSSTTAASTSIVGSAGSARARVLEVLRPDPEDHRARRPSPGRRLRRSGSAEAGELDRVVGELGLDEVHRRRADERGDEEVARLAVERLRRVDLLDRAVAHHRDARAERHRLDLVVRDVDRRDAEPLVQSRELGAHVDPELRVEVRERLVHQERGRLADDRPAHRDALALAARQRAGRRSSSSSSPSIRADLLDALLDLGLRRLPHLEAVAEVLRDGEVRVERVVLEDHRDVAVPRREPRHLALADPDLALGHLLEAGDHAQQRRLAAAGRADEDHELAARDREADVVDRAHVTRVDLSDPLEPDLGHVPVAPSGSLLTAARDRMAFSRVL